MTCYLILVTVSLYRSQQPVMKRALALSLTICLFGNQKRKHRLGKSFLFVHHNQAFLCSTIAANNNDQFNFVNDISSHFYAGVKKSIIVLRNSLVKLLTWMLPQLKEKNKKVLSCQLTQTNHIFVPIGALKLKNHNCETLEKIYNNIMLQIAP